MLNMSTHVTHKRLTLIYMSSYLSMWLHQVIFGSQGALAGVQGVAAVAVNVDGLPLRDRDATNEMELSGLPFQGSVRIGKKNVYFESDFS